MGETVDDTYLPFAPEQLRRHFLQSPGKHVDYYLRSAQRYHEFLRRPASPAAEAALPCQIEKDERFWTAAALLTLYHSPAREAHLAALLTGAFGPVPPISGISSWDACLSGSMHLSFETVLPSPPIFSTWLRQHDGERQLIPYIRRSCRDSRSRPLEGPTHVDALILNEDNGFAVAFEAKVLSDISCQIRYDIQRNQIARNIDVLLEAHADMPSPLCRRIPERTLFVLLTPRAFRQRPESRLYGWLFNDYRKRPESLARDLPHRDRSDWPKVAQRLGWLTWEEFQEALPGVCAWLAPRH